jgi:hypothetical protein
MVNATAGKHEACLQVIGLQIGHLVENLRRVQSGGIEVENVADANAHSPNARASSALFWVERDAIE